MIVPSPNSPAPATDAPAELARLVAQAEQAGASDLHLHAGTVGVSVSFRLDGVMQPITSLEGELGSRVLGRIKYLAKLKTYQDQLPQDGRIDRQDLGSQSDVRVATYPTVTGEKIVLRLFREADLPELCSLG
jgi:type II secretory ATPase GspE/PulE/Tfp pilus assembly ATPase PilB-like protein